MLKGSAMTDPFTSFGSGSVGFCEDGESNDAGRAVKNGCNHGRKLHSVHGWPPGALGALDGTDSLPATRPVTPTFI